MSAEEYAKLCALIQKIFLARLFDGEDAMRSLENIFANAWRHGVEECRGDHVRFHDLYDLAKSTGSNKA